SKKRWGPTEDQHMLRALPDYPQRPPGQDPVRWFQSTRGLEVDGVAGPQTRRKLIEAYMARDGTSLPREIDAVPHGCGEAFPLDSTGLDIDVAPVDGSGEPLDRRVELFFFCDKLGVQPPPASNVSKPGS